MLRGGGGLFYDRPDGNTVFSIPGNPPISTSQDLRNGQLQTLGSGLGTVGVPALIVFQYNAQVPSSWQWQGGVQMALPWAMALDVSYVGNHGFNRLRAFQGGANGSVDLNAVDIGAAYLPQNQDPTLGTEHGAGRQRRTRRTCCGRSAVCGNINEQQTRFWDEYHSIQMSLNRRFRNGLAFGTNYTLGLSLKGNTGLQMRLQHAADGTISIRADQAEYEKLNENLALQRHVIKSYRGVGSAERAGGLRARRGRYLLNDWQLSASSRPAPRISQLAPQTNNQTNGRYDLTYTYQNNGANVNLTGSPDYAGAGSSMSAIPGPAARTTSTGSSTRRRSPGRSTAASASSRGATSSVAAPTRQSTWRLPGTSGWAATARCNSASTCSTCSTSSSSTIASGTSSTGARRT